MKKKSVGMTNENTTCLEWVSLIWRLTNITKEMWVCARNGFIYIKQATLVSCHKTLVCIHHIVSKLTISLFTSFIFDRVLLRYKKYTLTFFLMSILWHYYFEKERTNKKEKMYHDGKYSSHCFVRMEIVFLYLCFSVFRRAQFSYRKNISLIQSAAKKGRH